TTCTPPAAGSWTCTDSWPGCASAWMSLKVHSSTTAAYGTFAKEAPSPTTSLRIASGAASNVLTTDMDAVAPSSSVTDTGSGLGVGSSLEEYDVDVAPPEEVWVTVQTVPASKLSPSNSWCPPCGMNEIGRNTTTSPPSVHSRCA